MDVSREEFRDLDRDVGKIATDVATLIANVRNMDARVEQLVHKAEFFPVKLIAYGLAAGALGAVITAIVQSVLR